MPLYSLYLLQPLDMGCFLLLKHVYGAKVNALIRVYIYYINKLSFLPVFKIVFKYAFIKENICLSF